MSDGRCTRTRIVRPTPGPELPKSSAASAHEGVAIVRPCDTAHAVEGPETVVDTVHLYLPCAPAAVLLGDDTFSHHERHDTVDAHCERRVGNQVARELFTKEPRREDELICAPETLHDEVAQAASHRVTHEERAGQDRHRCGHAKNHRDVRAPVMRQAAVDKP